MMDNMPAVDMICFGYALRFADTEEIIATFASNNFFWAYDEYKRHSLVNVQLLSLDAHYYTEDDRVGPRVWRIIKGEKS